MTATMEQAHDQIMGLFKTAWGANLESSGIAVHWPNVRAEIDTTRQTPTDAAKSWARISTQHVTGRQPTVGSADGTRRFRHTGLITVEIRVPTSRGMGLAWRLAKVALDAFRGKVTSGGVEFINPRPREIGNEGPWFRVDALIEFSYDEVV